MLVEIYMLCGVMEFCHEFNRLCIEDSVTVVEICF